jgi:nanoRNase/pAp phosphatase (c-di-AMP/oligoRNAs hydrolase)
MDVKGFAHRLVETVKKYRHLLIYIKGSPDPDAIAASYSLKLVCEHYGTEALILSPVYPSLPQNIKMVKELRLPIRFGDRDMEIGNFDAYAVLDHQSVSVDGVAGVIPCAIHIDHHERVEQKISVDLGIIVEEAGSTSSVMAFILEELEPGLNLAKPERVRVATALYYGMQTDTDNFSHAESLDMKALEIISRDYDEQAIAEISSIPFSKETIAFFTLALENRIVYKDWLISGIGFIDEKYRDSVAVIGDFLLKLEDISTAVVFFIIENKEGLTLNVSFRTKDEKFDMNALIKRITSEGGARKFKGAYQVNLDYFVHCPDKELLWKMVSLTTVEVLKKQRDSHGMEELKDFFRNLREKFLSLFK